MFLRFSNTIKLLQNYQKIQNVFLRLSNALKFIVKLSKS